MQPAEAKVIAKQVHPGRGTNGTATHSWGGRRAQSTVWVFTSTEELDWSGRRQMSGKVLE